MPRNMYTSAVVHMHSVHDFDINSDPDSIASFKQDEPNVITKTPTCEVCH